MPSLNILNTLILYSASSLADSDTGSADPAPVGPNVDPQLQQFINSFGQIGQPRDNAAPSAPVTVPSEVAHFSAFGEAPAVGVANLMAGASAAFAGADSPLPPSDTDSADPAPVGPNLDPGLQQFINSFGGQIGQPQDPSASPVPVITLPSAPAEPFHGSKFLSTHRVRLDP